MWSVHVAGGGLGGGVGRGGAGVVLGSVVAVDEGTSDVLTGAGGVGGDGGVRPGIVSEFRTRTPALVSGEAQHYVGC